MNKKATILDDMTLDERRVIGDRIAKFKENMAKAGLPTKVMLTENGMTVAVDFSKVIEKIVQLGQGHVTDISFVQDKVMLIEVSVI